MGGAYTRRKEGTWYGNATSRIESQRYLARRAPTLYTVPTLLGTAIQHRSQYCYSTTTGDYLGNTIQFWVS
jgi:hypothetical protein